MVNLENFRISIFLNAYTCPWKACETQVKYMYFRTLSPPLARRYTIENSTHIDILDERFIGCFSMAIIESLFAESGHITFNIQVIFKNIRTHILFAF